MCLNRMPFSCRWLIILGELTGSPFGRLRCLNRCNWIRGGDGFAAPNVSDSIVQLTLLTT